MPQISPHSAAVARLWRIMISARRGNQALPALAVSSLSQGFSLTEESRNCTYL
jgi:hypothetical protein